MTWYVRRASLRDRDALVKLCTVSVGPDDYVVHFLDDMILKEVVNVALGGDGRAIGMMAYRRCVDGAAWLGQARTHPDFRRQGVARALVDSFVGLARASGVPALRLWSESTNQEAIASFTACGFKEIARFVRVVGPSARGKAKAAPRTFDEDLWRQIAGSTIVARGRGYVSHDWTFVPATRPVAFVLVSQGLFRAWDGNLFTIARPSGDLEQAFAFTMWSGRPSELLSEACRQAAMVGRAHVETFLPHDRDLLAEARRAGFEPGSWGREAIFCELPVTAATFTRRVRPTYGELAGQRGQGHGHGDALGWARWNG